MKGRDRKGAAFVGGISVVGLLLLNIVVQHSFGLDKPTDLVLISTLEESGLLKGYPSPQSLACSWDNSLSEGETSVYRMSLRLRNFYPRVSTKHALQGWRLALPRRLMLFQHILSQAGKSLLEGYELYAY